MMVTFAEGGFVDPFVVASALASAIVIVAVIYHQRRSAKSRRSNR
jgi:hypothetical protein